MIKTFAISMFWLNFHQIAYIEKLLVFPSLYRLLFPVALEQNLTVSQESLLIFYIPNESISELKAEDQIVQGIVLATRTCQTLLLGLESTLLLGLPVIWKYIFQVRVMFLWARHKSPYIHINMIYVNKNEIFKIC